MDSYELLNLNKEALLQSVRGHGLLPEKRVPVYHANKLITSQYYGSIEILGHDVEPGGSPLTRKANRFRVEPSEELKVSDIVQSTSLAHLENPEFHTRWYFKYFLGQPHTNYVGSDVSGEAFALSVCVTDMENHGVLQYRAILWRKFGCRRVCFPYVPNKVVTVRNILRLFSLDRLDKQPRELIAPEVQKELLVLEEQEGSVNFKFGVIYAMKGQTTDDEMFGNVAGSKEFDDFLDVLGDRIELKGWTGYRGGLDVKDNMTGSLSLYTMYEGHEVMFHVSVMLPYSKDAQQVERKRHIGNDIAVIVFVDGDPDDEIPFKPSSIRTKFTHVFAVVRYRKHDRSYWLSVFSEENVAVCGPPLPIPPKFTNPQQFRSFLLTKLMNAEKAAYSSPVFSHKRQRTLESLIKGLQNEQYTKPEKFGIKRQLDEHCISDNLQNKDRKREFLDVGQSLKVSKITTGHAPTSVANVGGLLAVKNTPWEPQRINPTFEMNVVSGDSFGSKLVLSCESGIYLVAEGRMRLLFDRSMVARQLNVLERHGVMVMRATKAGRLYAVPLSEIENERPFPLTRRYCSRYYMRKTKGCHLYTLSRPESPFIALAVAIGKRVCLYTWGEASVGFGSCSSEPTEAHAGFELEGEFATSEPAQTLTIVHDSSEGVIVCLGLRTRFDIIDAQSKTVSTLKHIVAYKKPKIVSALDVFEESNAALLLTYNHTSVFVTLRNSATDVLTFNWDAAPLNIVCAFPYVLAFCENSIEIRLMINGNLVHSLSLPHLKLVTSKSDIYFCSTQPASFPEPKVRTMYKINLCDLAGLNLHDLDDGRAFDEIIQRRNVAPSGSSSNITGIVRNENMHYHVRSFSAAATLKRPVLGSSGSESPEVEVDGGDSSSSASGSLSRSSRSVGSRTIPSRKSSDCILLKGVSSEVNDCLPASRFALGAMSNSVSAPGSLAHAAGAASSRSKSLPCSPNHEVVLTKYAPRSPPLGESASPSEGGATADALGGSPSFQTRIVIVSKSKSLDRPSARLRFSSVDVQQPVISLTSTPSRRVAAQANFVSDHINLTTPMKNASPVGHGDSLAAANSGAADCTPKRLTFSPGKSPSKDASRSVGSPSKCVTVSFSDQNLSRSSVQESDEDDLSSSWALIAMPTPTKTTPAKMTIV